MHASAALSPERLPRSAYSALVQAVSCRTKDVCGVIGIERNRKERLAGQSRRASGGRLRNPCRPTVVAANRADSAISWKRVGDALAKNRVSITFACSDEDSVRIVQIDSDSTTCQAGAGKVSGVEIKCVHQ